MCIRDSLMTAVSVVCDAEVAGPWLDGVGFLPQFLGLGCVVLQVVAVLLQLLRVFGNQRGGEIGDRGLRVVVDLLDDLVAVDGHGDGLAAQMAFLVVAEVLETFRNDEGLERGARLAVGDHAGIAAERLHCGLRDFVHHVKVAGEHVGVCGILVRVDAVFDAVVGHLAAALVILVRHDDDVLVMRPGLELVRTVADRGLSELFDVLERHARQREGGLVCQLGREHGIRLVQFDDQRVVVRGGKASPLVNFQPFFSLIVYLVASSFGVMLSATSRCCLLFASKLTRPSNR